MTESPTRVFLSYRREDTRYAAARLGDRLRDRFGQVFMDIDTIEPGFDFTETIRRAVSECHVVLALIGDRWASAVDQQGHRRLDDPDDWIVQELREALDRGIRVIPVLVDGAHMPNRRDLPEGLAPLAKRQGVPLRFEAFSSDAGRLISAIERALPTPNPPDAERGVGRVTRSTPDLPAPHYGNYGNVDSGQAYEASDAVSDIPTEVGDYPAQGQHQFDGAMPAPDDDSSMPVRPEPLIDHEPKRPPEPEPPRKTGTHPDGRTSERSYSRSPDGVPDRTDSIAKSRKPGRRGLLPVVAVLGALATIIAIGVLSRISSQPSASNTVTSQEEETTQVNLGGAQGIAPTIDLLSSGPSTPTNPQPTESNTPSATGVGFNGGYAVHTVVTNSNTPAVPVGLTSDSTWTVVSTCMHASCDASVKSTSGTEITLSNTGTILQAQEVLPITCSDNGPRIDDQATFNLAPTLAGGTVTALSGNITDRYRACPGDPVDPTEITRQLTASRID